MNELQIFIKGQIWYWEDPIYGRKNKNHVIPDNEVTQRYNRYVMIYQSLDTMDDNDNSVLVIPFTSELRTDGVKVHILTLGGGEAISYARTSKIFPVSKYSLKRYICTLSGSDIRNIDMAMTKLFTFDKDEIIKSIKLEEHRKRSKSTKEGLASARARGRVGGRPKADADAVKAAIILYFTGEYTVSQIHDKTNVSKSTLYRYLKKDRENKKESIKHNK